jgi:hypothetical protein
MCSTRPILVIILGQMNLPQTSVFYFFTIKFNSSARRSGSGGSRNTRIKVDIKSTPVNVTPLDSSRHWYPHLEQILWINTYMYCTVHIVLPCNGQTAKISGASVTL